MPTIDFASLADLEQDKLKAALIDIKLSELKVQLKAEEASLSALRVQLDQREKGWSRALAEFRRRHQDAEKKKRMRELAEKPEPKPRDLKAQTEAARAARAENRANSKAKNAMNVLLQTQVDLGAPSFILELELDAEASAKLATWCIMHPTKLSTLTRGLVSTIIKTPSRG